MESEGSLPCSQEPSAGFHLPIKTTEVQIPNRNFQKKTALVNLTDKTVELLGRVISPSQGLNTNTEETHMPRVGFQRAKTFRALDGAATVIGR
jgi:hypothetical protein